MPYTTLVAGTTITASWANANARDQVVTPFASTGARDSAITAPVAGMLSVITTNASSEGVVQYTSAGTWRKPWNLPWGIQALVSVTSAQTGIGTTFTDVTSLTATLTSIGSRRLKFTAFIIADTASTTGQTVELRILRDATQVNKTQRAFTTTLQDGITLTCVDAPAAGSPVYKVQARVTSGTFNVDNASTSPAYLLIEDIGASGSPT